MSFLQNHLSDLFKLYYLHHTSLTHTHFHFSFFAHSLSQQHTRIQFHTTHASVGIPKTRNWRYIFQYRNLTLPTLTFSPWNLSTNTSYSFFLIPKRTLNYRLFQASSLVLHHDSLLPIQIPLAFSFHWFCTRVGERFNKRFRVNNIIHSKDPASGHIGPFLTSVIIHFILVSWWILWPSDWGLCPILLRLWMNMEWIGLKGFRLWPWIYDVNWAKSHIGLNNKFNWT